MKKNEKKVNHHKSNTDFLGKFLKTNKQIVTRIKNLEKKELYCEIFLWLGLLFESSISMYLATYEEIIHGIGELDNSPLKTYKPDAITHFREGKFTLGRLITEFSKVANEEKLIKKLYKFNDERNKLIHKFIDLECSVCQVNSNLKSKYKEYYKLYFKVDDSLFNLLIESSVLQKKILTKGEKNSGFTSQEKS